MELEGKTIEEIIDLVKSQGKDIDHETLLSEYHPDQHKVTDLAERPNKTVQLKDGGTKSVPVARLPLSFQQLIVDRAAAFLIGEGITFNAKPDGDADQLLIDMLERTWHDNKLGYRTREMARTWMSEREVAELWYFEEKEVFQDLGISAGQRMRMQILSPSRGDKLYPYFDEYGDMVAFGRGYEIGDTEYFELYTKEQTAIYADKDGWELLDMDKPNPAPNLLGKIPVVYYHKDKTEWADVQPLIERLETMISNFADSNDYFASPMVKVKGTVHGFADKGEQGKVITMEENADASYLTWDQAPAAIQLEKETLQEFIMMLTQTPDISFKQMKGLGALSGVALKLMFMDAKLKTLKHQEEFGEGVQRRINIIKKGMSLIANVNPGLTIEPEFNFYLPDNEKEKIDMLVQASGNAPIMSQKTAISLNPFVVDPETELEEIKQDQESRFGNIFPEPL